MLRNPLSFYGWAILLHTPQYFWQLSFATSVLQSGLAASHQLSLFSHFFSAPSSAKNEISLVQLRNAKINILNSNYYLCTGRNIFDNFLLLHPSCSQAWHLHTIFLYFHISSLHLYLWIVKSLVQLRDTKISNLVANYYLRIGCNIFDNFLLPDPSGSRAWLFHTKLLYFHISYLQNINKG